jgi:hypothetical protein
MGLFSGLSSPLHDFQREPFVGRSLPYRDQQAVYDLPVASTTCPSP